VAVDQAATRPEWRLIRSPLGGTFATAILLPFVGGGQSMAVSLVAGLVLLPAKNRDASYISPIPKKSLIKIELIQLFILYTS
jgi:hypothetical protein